MNQYKFLQPRFAAITTLCYGYCRVGLSHSPKPLRALSTRVKIFVFRQWHHILDSVAIR